MEGISDIRICGFDEKRPPKILKEPYIDLFFELKHQAPKDWCEDFNGLVVKDKYTAKINPATGLFIETWVRNPDEIKDSLAMLAKTVATCNEEYISRIEAQIKASENNSQDKSSDDSEQARLNKIVAALNFEE